MIIVLYLSFTYPLASVTYPFAIPSFIYPFAILSRFSAHAAEVRHGPKKKEPDKRVYRKETLAKGDAATSKKKLSKRLYVKVNTCLGLQASPHFGLFDFLSAVRRYEYSEAS